MMRTYDSYKDSGIEWIGEIPRHWISTPLKHLCSIENGKEFSSIQVESGGYPVYGTGGEFSRCSEFLYHGPSVLLGRKGTIDKPILVYEPFWTSDTIYYTVIKSMIKPEFMFYQVCQIPFSLFSYGSTIPSMTKSHYENMRFPLPPLSEQEQIVSYLDEKTSLIDEMVEKKKRKIELLKEYRTSLINTVVTKGLNPDVPMKDSGIEWIGEIPRHWELKRLKYVCNVSTGSRDTQDRVEDGLYPFFVRSPIVEKINSYSYDGEGVLTVGDGVGTGKVFHYFNGKFEYHQRVYLFSNFSGILGRYFYDYMKVKFINVTEDQNSKSTVDSLRRPLIDNFTFVLPPISEQEQIVSYLDEKTSEIDITIELENKKIELLKEYRQSLISNVVTGKIKVVSE